VIYATMATDDLAPLVAGLGAAGMVVVAVALAGRWASLVPWGLVGVGGGYAVFVALRSATVDPWAPVVAAALISAAEIAFRSLEPQSSHPGRVVVIRSLLALGAGALTTALLGNVLLLVTGGRTSSVPLEAAGVASAVLLLAGVAGLSVRRSSSSVP
jgi:hypothetical protein